MNSRTPPSQLQQRLRAFVAPILGNEVARLRKHDAPRARQHIRRRRPAQPFVSGAPHDQHVSAAFGERSDRGCGGGGAVAAQRFGDRNGLEEKNTQQTG